MSFKLGKKVLIVNDAAQAQLLFFAKLASGITRLVETDDDFNTATPFDDLEASPDVQSGAEGAGYLPADVATDSSIAQADMLRITGFADLIGSDIVEVIGAKGVPGAKQVSTVTITGSTFTAGEEIVVNITFKAADNRGEFASHLSDYKRKRTFIIPVKAGDTLTLVAARLKAQIDALGESGTTAWVTAAAALGVVTLTSTDNAVTFEAAFEGNAITSAHLAAAFATTTTGYEGRNTYAQLKGLRLETNNDAYGVDFNKLQIPIKGAKYSSYLIKKRVVRDDLAGIGGSLNSVPTGDFLFEIFINESTASAYITNLIKWLNANVAARTMYTTTTAAVAVGAESPTVETVVAASPFTAGLT